MTYPVKVGIQEKLERFAGREMHEFLVAIGDGHATGLSVPSMDTWSADAPILGYIDLNTGRKSNIPSNISWTETDENVRSKAYTKYFEPRTVYRVKGYAYELKEGEEYNKWNSGITVAEIIMAGEFNAFLAQLYAEWDSVQTMESELFGQMTYDKKYEYYSGSFNWLGTQITIELDDESENVKESLRLAEEMCRNCVEWDKKFKEKIADELTYLANDWLRDADKPEITEEEFISKITISLINMSDYKGGTFSVWYDDNDNIFAGHSIHVYGNFTEGIKSARMEG